MTDRKASQLNLIGVLFFVHGFVLIFCLALISHAGKAGMGSSRVFNLMSAFGFPIYIDSQTASRVILFGSLVFMLISFLTGICILKRVSFLSSCLGSILILLAMPLGTFLGFWSLKVLSETESRQLFLTEQSD